MPRISSLGQPFVSVLAFRYLCKWFSVFGSMNDRVKYWLEMLEYDFDTAKAMFETKRYLYVGFMCHQVIEKC